jgi:hypothetical protein
LTLEATEFVRRLLLHILLKGLVRICHYGILSNHHQREDLALCHRLLNNVPTIEAAVLNTGELLENTVRVAPTGVWPNCGADRMISLAEFAPMAIGIKITAKVHTLVVVDTT